MSLILPRARDRPHFYKIATAHLYLLILGYSHFHELSRLVKSLSEYYNLVIVSINELIFFVVCSQDQYWCLLLFHTDADGFGAASYLKI